MSDYLHGAYGNSMSAGTKLASESATAMIYFGTAPVHNVVGGSQNVNKPIVVSNMAEAKKYFGYNDNWASYTLCEAMHVHFDLFGIGPIILVNVLDPATHKESTGGSESKTPADGKILLTNGAKIVVDSVTVSTKTKGTDYTVYYEEKTETVVIKELTSGGLGTSALNVTWDIVKPEDVDSTDVIGSTDAEGTNTGLYVIKNVYQMTGYIPSFMLCPGFGETKTVHDAMATVSRRINGHFDAWMLTDIPLMNNSTPMTFSSASTWKTTNLYNRENETVNFPAIKGTDGKIYHISVLRAAVMQQQLKANGNIPYTTASNKECPIAENLYISAASANKVYDDEVINEKLNKNGIASAAYVGGRWAFWGAHAADYAFATGTYVNVSETARMMLFYISNNFQHRRMNDIDKPISANDIKSIVADEQARLDALVKIGALTYGEVALNATPDTQSDMINGDYSFTFNVTTTPIAKSLTANVYWTDDGFVTYFADMI